MLFTDDYRELAEKRQDRRISIPSEHYLELVERVEVLEQLVWVLAQENRLEQLLRGEEG